MNNISDFNYCYCEKCQKPVDAYRDAEIHGHEDIEYFHKCHKCNSVVEERNLLLEFHKHQTNPVNFTDIKFGYLP